MVRPVRSLFEPSALKAIRNVIAGVMVASSIRWRPTARRRRCRFVFVPAPPPTRLSRPARRMPPPGMNMLDEAAARVGAAVVLTLVTTAVPGVTSPFTSSVDWPSLSPRVTVEAVMPASE